jgi:hypothetical protein
MTPAETSPSRISCTAIAAIRKPKTFSVTSMRFSSSFSLTRFAQRNTTTSSSRTKTKMPNATAKTLNDLDSAEMVIRPTMRSAAAGTCQSHRPR